MSTTPDRKNPKPRTWPGPLVPILAGLAVLVAALAGGIWLDTAPAESAGAAVGGPFTLVGGDGKPVTDREFRGRFMLIYFGYTFCPDACPTTLNSVADALQRRGPKADRLQPLFITVDPKRDTPAVVAQYVKAFTPRLVGLTGSPAALLPVEKEYRVYAAVEKTGPGPDDYSVDHSSVLYLMDPQGRFVTVLRADQPGSALAQALAPYLS